MCYKYVYFLIRGTVCYFNDEIDDNNSIQIIEGDMFGASEILYGK